MKASSVFYQSLLKVYQAIPFKRLVCGFLKLSKIPNGKFYKDLRFNGQFTVHLKDKKFKIVNHKFTIENEVFWKGVGESWEEETIWVWIELCKDARVVFDVGANFGIYSLITKSLNGAAEVYAFEPVARTYKCLTENAELNKFQIHTEMLALSNLTGKQIFFDEPNSDQTSASLSPDKLKFFSGFHDKVVEYEVFTITMDKYIEDHDINFLDLVKIDVELHEPAVIEGFLKHLSKFKPAIVIEVLTEEVAEKLNQYFLNTEYRIFHLVGRNSMVEKSKMEAHPYLWNYLLCCNKTVENLKQFIK